MNTNGRANRAAILFSVLLACSPLAALAAPQNAAPTLKVDAVVNATSVRIEARSVAAFEYSTYRPSENLFIADVAGAMAEGTQNARVLDSSLVSSYRVLQYRSGDRPIVRLEVLLRTPVEPRVDRDGNNGLTLDFEGAAAESTPAAAAPAPAPAETAAAPVPAPAMATVVAPEASTPATRPTATGPQAKAIQAVSIASQGKQVRVCMEGDGRLVYSVTRLRNPDRLVFDFNGAKLRLAKRSLASSVEPVRAVRAGQFKPDQARVVIDLARSGPYSVNAEGNALTVMFGAPTTTAASQPAENAAPATAPAPGDSQNTTSVGTQTGASDANSTQAAPAPEPAKPVEAEPTAPAETQSGAQSVPQPAAQPGETETKPAPQPVETQALATDAERPANAAAPAETVPQSNISVPETPAPQPSAAMPREAGGSVANGVMSTAEAKPEPAAPTNAQPVDPIRPSARMQDQQPAAAAAAAAQTTSAPATPKYSGEPISVNLKDVDLKDFFRLIHEISGLNIVMDPAVKGSLTIVLDDVPWDQALDIVLQNNGLDKQLTGNVLRIATIDTVKKEAEAQRDLVKAQSEAVPQVTATRVLSYAKASTIRDTLKRFLSSRGDILSDDRSNTLIIRDIPAVLPDIDALIKQLDRKSQQVEIEARVVSASRTFSREIGTQFGISADANHGRNIFGGLAGNPAFTSPIIRGPALPTPPLVSQGSNAIPLNTNLGATTPTSGLSYSFTANNFALDFIISAAEARGVGKLLSKPKVITQNNEKATVKQGEKIPVQTVINNTISTQFIDAVLKLEVTPQITAEGTVYMEVVVENTQIDNGVVRVQGIPALTTQSAETKVLVNDGGTVVIGGVIISNQQTNVAQVPLLGSIPVIGHLFKHTTVSTSSQELLFFLTPRIVPT